MAYRFVSNVVGASAGNPIVLDRWLGSPVILEVDVSGTVLYSVQHTFADPFAVGGIPSGSWRNHAGTVLTSATADAEDNFAVAPTAVRLVNWATTSGESTLTVLQNGGFPT